MTTRPSARQCAVRVLVEVDKDPHCHAADRVHQIGDAERLPKRDRRFLHELVLGVLRRRMTLDGILQAYSSMPLSEMERRVLQVLRLGVYQLLYTDGVPAFAAVSSTVSLVGKDRRKRSFVNAILRRVDDECRRVRPEQDRGGASPRKRLELRSDKVCFFSRAVFPDPQQDLAAWLATVHSHPRAAVARWLEAWGPERTEELLRAGNEIPPVFLRVQRRRVEPEECLDALHREGLRCVEGPIEGSLRLESPVAELIRSRPFRDGLCTIQDLTAMKVAPLVDPRAGERILDACAAPGGKAAHLHDLCPEAEIVALDRDADRAARLQQNLRRLGLESVETRVGDLRDDAASLGSFDAVLVDAPCSNSGVFRRKPEARYRLDDDRLGALVEQQDALLDAALRRLKPTGRLVYSTCSIEPRENEARIAALLARNAGWSLERSWSEFPSSGGGDGGFAGRLVRSEGDEAPGEGGA